VNPRIPGSAEEASGHAVFALDEGLPRFREVRVVPEEDAHLTIRDVRLEAIKRQHQNKPLRVNRLVPRSLGLSTSRYRG
jgi:hypothetical protein